MSPLPTHGCPPKARELKKSSNMRSFQVLVVAGAMFLAAFSSNTQPSSPLNALIFVVGVEAKKPIRPTPTSGGSRPRPTATSTKTTTRSRTAGAQQQQPARSRPTRSTSGPLPQQKRRPAPVYDEENDNEEEEFVDLSDESSPTTLVVDDEEEDEDDSFAEDEQERVSNRPRTARTRPPPANRLSRERSTRSSSNLPRRGPTATASRPARPQPQRRYAEEDDEEDEDGDEYEDSYPVRRSTSRAPSTRRGNAPPGGPRRGPSRGPPNRRGGSVVPYTNKPTAGASAFLMKGFSSIVSALPDPATVKDAAVSGLSAARQTTTHLSSNLYREVKGLTSSELEQVMLKATRPDDTPVKGKHVERLVGVTYQISGRYDIYDAVLRKLWSKMAERDWRTTVKAVYLLHRFAADGAPAHAPALKARLRELRRTRDPKRGHGGEKYFSSKLLLAGDANPETIPFRAFLSRYAHYVLLRSQSFGGMFDEIGQLPTTAAATATAGNKGKQSNKKSTKVVAAAAAAAASSKPLTSTCLREEYLNAARVLLKAGIVCTLKDGEECENTAIASERVASDLIGLTTAVAIALNRALKDNKSKNDPALLKKWCLFYRDELLPQTKAMVKKTSPKLDAYGLFLPSRMGASVAPDVLEKGLQEVEAEEEEEEVTAAKQQQGEPEDEEDDQDDVTSKRASTAAMPTAEADKPTPVKAAVSPVSEALVEEDEAVEEEAGFDEEYEYEEEEYYDDEE